MFKLSSTFVLATSNSAATYPDDYSTGTYTVKTTYVSLSGRYTGNCHDRSYPCI